MSSFKSMSPVLAQVDDLQIPVFVYGTLLQAKRPHSLKNMFETMHFIGKACFQGQMYLVADYPGVIASTQATDLIYGELYRLNSVEQLQQLDDYEQCSERYPQPREYERVKVNVVDSNNEIKTVWIYLYAWPVLNLKRIATYED